MPIGTGKGSLFGGGVSVEAGSQTFNSPGTFTVPPGLTKVSICGRGGSGNSGTSGGDGPSGAGGSGGHGGALTFTPCGTPGYFPAANTATKPGSSGGAGGNAHFAPSGGAAGNAGTPTSVFCTTVGNTGTGGTAGTGGHGANAGNPGGAGPTTYTQQANHSSCPVSGCRGVGGNADATNPTGAGGAGVPTLYAGRLGGYGVRGKSCITFSCGPISIAWAKGWGGTGGGGAGAANEGTYQCNSRTYPLQRSPVVTGGTAFCCSPLAPYIKGGNGGVGAVTDPTNANNGFLSSASGNSGSHGQPDNYHVNWGGSNPSPPSGYRSGALGGSGGGGGGGGSSMCKQYYRGEVGGGGGGGGSGGQAVYGNVGNPGNQGNPSAVNCITVSTGDYPVVVGNGGTVTISWNAQ